MQTCTISVDFNPTVPGDSQDIFNIPSSDTDTPQLLIGLSGTGVSNTPVLEVTPADVIQLPNVLTGQTRAATVTVANVGGGQLIPGGPTVSGTDAGVFT